MKMLDWRIIYLFFTYLYICVEIIIKKTRNCIFLVFRGTYNSMWLFVSYNPQTFTDSVIHLTSMYIHMLVITNYSVFFKYRYICKHFFSSNILNSKFIPDLWYQTIFTLWGKIHLKFRYNTGLCKTVMFET